MRVPNGETFRSLSETSYNGALSQRVGARAESGSSECHLLAFISEREKCPESFCAEETVSGRSPPRPPRPERFRFRDRLRPSVSNSRLRQPLSFFRVVFPRPRKGRPFIKIRGPFIRRNKFLCRVFSLVKGIISPFENYCLINCKHVTLSWHIKKPFSNSSSLSA